MKYELGKDFIKISGKEDFNIEHILECGQVFSFVKNDNYIVYSADKKADIFEDEKGFLIKTNDPKYFENYFDLKTNYGETKNKLSKFEIMKKPLKFGYGIRILKQNLFETLISFIVSANNNIKRIKQILFKIRENYGTKVGDYFAFPTRQQLLKATVDDFAKMGAGYRAKYLFEVVRQIDENTLQHWQTLDTKSLKKNLVSLMGVGPKVASCILLFGFGRGDVFPVDTWMHQMYEKFYGKQSDRQKIETDLIKRFENLSGYAQQYLFYSMRMYEIN